MSLDKARAALQTANYIDGAWVKPEKTFDVVSGATGAVFAQCPLATPDMAAAAAAAAAAAFKTWGKTPAAERAGWLKCVGQREKRREESKFGVEPESPPQNFHFLSHRCSARPRPSYPLPTCSKLADELEKRKEDVAS